jgi:hypothetical protein
LLVRFFSTKTTFMRFISSITLFVCNKISDFISFKMQITNTFYWNILRFVELYII